MSCSILPSCFQQNACGEIRKVLPGAIYAPFVSVRFGDTITVGNQSNPSSGNRACIKSMEYGASDGNTITLEIMDEQGGSFALFMEKLSKEICQVGDEYNFFVDFGWMIEHCDGSKTWKKVTDNGRPLRFLGITMEAAYEQGKIKFTVKGEDMLSRVGENRVDRPIGSARQRVPLSRAMTQIFEENCPRVGRVLRQRRNAQGALVDWGFRNSDGGPNGPNGVWPADQQNALSVVRKWLNGFTTDRRRGVTPVWDCGAAEPTLIFLESSTPDPCENPVGCNRGRSIGTYIVNGGDCSPVISFSPKAEWQLAASGGSGAGMSGGATQRSTRTRSPRSRCAEGILRSRSNPRPVGGTQTTVAVPQNQMDIRPPDLLTRRIMEGVAAQERAAKKVELRSPIEAELKIQGNPDFVHPIRWVDRTVAIIVINPYHLLGDGCGDWLALPVCNSVYSDKNWWIKGVNHTIKEGSYTTTIKVSMLNLAKTGSE